MNRPNPDDDAEITDAELIAFSLHDLSPAREQAVRDAIRANPSLAAEAESFASAFGALKEPPMHIDDAVLERNWKALQPLLTKYSSPIPRFSRWRRPVFAGLVFASAATIAYVVPVRHLAAVNDADQATAAVPARGQNSPAPTSPELGSSQSVSPLPWEPSSRAKVGSGVFYLKPHQASSAIQMLALGDSNSVAEAIPGLAPVEGGLTATPLSLIPVLPQVSTSVSGTEDLTQQQTHFNLPVQVRSSTGGTLPSRARHVHTTDLMLGMGGTFIAPHASLTAGTEPRTLTATHAVAALAAFHQQFRPALGYRVTALYTRPDFAYGYSASNSSGSFSSGDINSSIFELAATYVIEGPHRRRLSTSIDAGATLLAFVPTPSPDTSYGYRPGGVLGANLDFAITKHLGARLAYRAQIFRSPDFRYTGGSIPVTTSVIVSNEPALGITYRFGKR